MPRPEKRSLTIKGHRTSMTLEPAFWEALEELAQARDQSISGLVTQIDHERSLQDPDQTLSGAVRVFVLNAVRGPS